MSYGGNFMNTNLHLFMVKHGAVVALLGACSGLMYTFVLTGDISGSMRAWHLAHLQGIVIGVLILAASSYITHLGLAQKGLRIVAYSFVITGYCYSIGPIFGAIFNVRGIEPVMPVSNLLMYLSNLVASISIVIGLALTFYGAAKKRASSPGTQ